MRRRFYILLILLGSVLHVSAGLTSEEQTLRDSIFNVYHSMPADTMRVEYLKSMYQQNIRADWSIELADSALQAARVLGNGRLELMLCHEAFRYSQYRGDLQEMERRLAVLKECCYRQKSYEYYFSAWEAVLDLQCSRGNIEYAILQAKQMKADAEELGYEKGICTSYIALGSAYGYSEQYAEGAEAYKEALKCPTISTREKLDTYWGLSGCYIGLKDEENAVIILNQEKEILEKLANAKPTNYPLYRDRLLDNQLRFCQLYAKIKEIPKLKSHLLIAKKHYTENVFLPYYFQYHLSWADYYHLVQDWDACFPELDLVLERSKGMQPWYEQNVRKTKAQYLWDAGRQEDALEAYKEIVQIGDSLIQYFREQQTETVQSNYRIKKELMKQAENENKVRWLTFASAMVLFIIILVFTVRTLYFRSLLRKDEAETRAASELARKANHMKDIFLKNIVDDIKVPLDSVVHLSKLLSVERDTLSIEQRTEYSSSITVNAERLITLVNNVLDLSRLESGMMRFDVQSYDVVQLCRDAVYMAGMQEGNLATVSFEHDVESLMLCIDSSRFHKLMTSMFTAKDAVTIHCKLIVTGGEQEIKLVVTGSPLSASSPDRLRQIQHDINRLFIEIFHGSYTIESEETCITVCFPLA
jgi:signal transduction histidine kinase|nr:histidine kinase dimerization/phospho-acceptor domain-containing protein [Bacteroides intestinalis]